MEEPELQPLRIISGWNVEWNLFYEVDPAKETMHYLDSSSLLHLNNKLNTKAINLEWKPENDVNGNYILRVINIHKKTDEKGVIIFESDWENLHFELKTKSRLEIVREIERLVMQV